MNETNGTPLPRRIALLEKYKEENRIARETLKAALEDSPDYEAAASEAKAAAQKKKQIKDQLWSTPDNQALLQKIKENQEEIATLEEILNTELMDFYQRENVDEIPDESGEPRKFKVSVKLLPKGNNRYAQAKPTPPAGSSIPEALLG